MELKLSELQESAKAIAGIGGSNVDSNWLDKINEVVKNINQLLELYVKLGGLPGQSKARAQTSTDYAQPLQLRGEPSHLRDEKNDLSAKSELEKIAKGLINFLVSMESKGYSDMPIGQVITNLPVSVKQAREFLEARL